jgi:HSP20 family protein
LTWYDPTVAFVRWDPLQDLLATQQRLNRLVTGPTGWTPAVDVLETPDRYVVMVELPGLSQDDVQLQHHEGHLTISGVRRERESPCEQFHRIERGHGSFSRTFQLPLPVDAERITADLRDGVLTVTCPKATDPSVRRIHIS